MSPARWVWAIYSDFSGSVGIRGKRGLRGAGGWNKRPRGSVADCIGSSGSREISRRISETDPGPPARWVRVIYSDFSGSVGIRRKRGLSGAGGEICDPGYVADCVESSGNRDVSHRISETDPCRPRGGFAPFTRISLDLSEFGENGAYVARGGGGYGPPGPCQIA